MLFSFIVYPQALLLKTGNLTEMYLQYSNIGSDVICNLAEALCTNMTLKVLLLNGCPTEEAGAASIADMMGKNQCLVKLDLTTLSVGAVGAIKLVESLQHNSTSRPSGTWEVQVSHHHSSVQWGSGESEMVQWHCTQEVVNLSGSKVDLLTLGECQLPKKRKMITIVHTNCDETSLLKINPQKHDAWREWGYC